ncbi:MAG: UvrABC system protein [Candidatus Parcubacteria bacterium]|nr:UvrABC system protein [Candidatus Parcubacteria bacterium]
MLSTKLPKLNMPDEPGVYTFRDAKKRPMYIGRATSLKDRVRSYFAADLIATRGPRIVDMVTKAHTVTWEPTGSVLEAILLETELIKRYQPFYNVDERDDKSAQYVVITAEPWPRVFLARARDLDQALKEGTAPYKIKRRFGPYHESGLIKVALKILRRLFPFRDKKSLDERHDAFYRAIGHSPHDTDEDARKRYLRTINYLILFFEGKKKILRRRLEKQMNAAAKELQFEEAGQIRYLLHALDHINDMALIKRDISQSGKFGASRAFRMEAYDIAHLSGMETVGAMVVSTNGQLAPAEYRKFKISRNANNDIAGLTETLFRRLNHPEWPYPDLIIVDGNETQAKHAENVLKARRIAIPVVGVTKNERHVADRLVGNPDLTEPYKAEIIALNAEAHRFAIAYHRQRRNKRLLS